MKEIRGRAYVVTLSICVLLGLAIMPWVLSSQSSRPLLPDALRREPEYYEATRAAAEATAINDMRKAPSTVTVRIVVTPAAPTLTAPRIVVRSETELASPTETPVELPTVPPIQTRPGTVLPASPPGMVTTEDVITEEMLTEQVKQDAGNGALSNLSISLAPEGISAVAVVTLLPGITRRIEASGTLAVENYSLVVKVSSIQLDGRDVTENYREQLENSLNSSLYRLLSQRYVQSYELRDGEIRVYSKVRP